MHNGSKRAETEKTGAQASAANACGGSAAKSPRTTDLHVCMGLNTCKGQDRPGTAPMAGLGQCATVEHACHVVSSALSPGIMSADGISHQRRALLARTSGERPIRLAPDS